MNHCAGLLCSQGAWRRSSNCVVRCKNGALCNPLALRESSRMSFHYQVARPEEIVGAIDIAKSSGAAALNVLAGPLMFNNRQTIMERVAALGLPAMFQSPEIAEYGGFIAYGARLDQLYRDVQARQLVMLARGARVADVPAE